MYYNKRMAYVSNIKDLSYDHKNTQWDARFNDVIVDGAFTAPNYKLHSSRINTALDPQQELLSADPNPSYIQFVSDIQEGVYNYDNSDGDWVLTDPTTITINTTGDYLVGISINLVTNLAPGTVVLQIFNSIEGPIGTVPPITSAKINMDTVPFPTIFTYVGIGVSSAMARIQAGTTLKVAYITSKDCFVTPSSCISICKLSKN